MACWDGSYPAHTRYEELAASIVGNPQNRGKSRERRIMEVLKPDWVKREVVKLEDAGVEDLGLF